MISRKHALEGEGSYTSFERFVREHGIRSGDQRATSTCRIDVSAGHQAQIDYAKVGLFFDRQTQRRRVLFAFIGTLSHRPGELSSGLIFTLLGQWTRARGEMNSHLQA